MALSNNRLSRLMKLSWDIQHSRNRTRSKSLQDAWAIIQNDDITLRYLTRKLNHNKPVPYKVQSQFALFNQ